MVRPQCRPLYVNPAAMAWLIHNTIRLHHVVQNVSIDVRLHYNSCCEVIVCKTKAHISWMSKIMMPLGKKKKKREWCNAGTKCYVCGLHAGLCGHCGDFGNMSPIWGLSEFNLMSSSILQVALRLCFWCGQIKGFAVPWSGCMSTMSMICRCANVRFKLWWVAHGSYFACLLSR